ASPTSPPRSSATAPGLPDEFAATAGGDSGGDLPGPMQKACEHARVYDDAGSAGGSRKGRPPDCLSLVQRTTSPPNLAYGAQYLACSLPGQRFACSLAVARA